MRTIIHAKTQDGRGAGIQRVETRLPVRERMYAVWLEGESRAVRVSRSLLKLALRNGCKVLGRLQTWEG